MMLFSPAHFLSIAVVVVQTLKVPLSLLLNGYEYYIG